MYLLGVRFESFVLFDEWLLEIDISYFFKNEFFDL